jgi:phosphoglycerol transferase MdoB-like AlkP superfamily enzyme
MPIFSAIILVSAGITYLIVKRTINFLENLPSRKDKIKNLALYTALFGISLYAIPALANLENNDNLFGNEIQANGYYKFYHAFTNSKLAYNTFYKTIPIQQAFTLLQKQLPGVSQNNILRSIKSDSSEIHKNIVLITLESFSADFMKTYGNTENITPFLDSLATQSMLFTNLYAAGNRTVRGLEAVTLCLPPSPAESVVKQIDNKNKFSTGSLLKQKGYQVKFLYGGNALFDNMGDFFSGNGYDIVDKKSFTRNEISFSNIWGVCDEDLYHKAINVMNTEAKANQSFFNHIMTVSNHRPFTYPNNKIDIPSTSKSRSGGVKYTDYALRQFFRAAQNQPWFKNTVFVVLADHCASSAGNTELPMDKYRIPAFIYAPGFIPPGEINTLMSQIDIMPTLFGKLQFQYQSKFYGQDIFQSDYKPRAFIATYQDLGLIKDNLLTILTPIKQVKQFQLIPVPNPKVKPNFQLNFKEVPIKIHNNALVKQTIAFYQTTAFLLKNKKYQHTSTPSK